VLVLVTAGEFVIAGDMRDRLGGEPEDVAEALGRVLRSAAAQIGSFPERVTVRFDDIAGPLAARLASASVAVDVADALPNLESVARDFLGSVAGSSLWPPVSIADTWSSWRLPAATVRELFDAAATFWGRAPRTAATNQQALDVLLPSGRTRMGRCRAGCRC
jgi:hypothetical protein